MKLNLGCGHNHIRNFLNLAKEAELKQDQQVDLEVFSWPSKYNVADEVLMTHVLNKKVLIHRFFLSVMKELFRVCKSEGVFTIADSHPCSDTYLADPTFFCPVLPKMRSLFFRNLSSEWKMGAFNTTLAFY